MQTERLKDLMRRFQAPLSFSISTFQDRDNHDHVKSAQQAYFVMLDPCIPDVFGAVLGSHKTIRWNESQLVP